MDHRIWTGPWPLVRRLGHRLKLVFLYPKLRHLLIIGGKADKASIHTETLATEPTKSSKWVISPELPEPRESMSSILFQDGSVCIYGGVNNGLEGEKTVFCSRQPFKSSTMSETAPWISAGELLESRREHRSILHHSKSMISW